MRLDLMNLILLFHKLTSMKIKNSSLRKLVSRVNKLSKRARVCSPPDLRGSNDDFIHDLIGYLTLMIKRMKYHFSVNLDLRPQSKGKNLMIS